MTHGIPRIPWSSIAWALNQLMAPSSAVGKSQKTTEVSVLSTMVPFSLKLGVLYLRMLQFPTMRCFVSTEEANSNPPPRGVSFERSEPALSLRYYCRSSLVVRGCC